MTTKFVAMPCHAMDRVLVVAKPKSGQQSYRSRVAAATDFTPLREEHAIPITQRTNPKSNLAFRKSLFLRTSIPLMQQNYFDCT